MKKVRTEYSLLEPHRAAVSRCVKCGSCRTVCPSFLITQDESRSPRGRMALIQAVLNGKLSVSDVFEDRLATCMTCLACEAACASSVPVTGIIQAAKEQAVLESGRAFLTGLIARVLRNEHLLRSGSWLAPLVLHYSPSSTRGQKGKGSKFNGHSKGRDGRKKGTVLFFPGCSINYFQPEIGKSAVNVLNGIGYQVVVPEVLQCCGRPLLSLGDREGAEKAAAHNARILAGTPADAVVTLCASCSLTFKREYPRLLAPGKAMPAILDIHEFLAANDAWRSAGPVRKTVTWHDPCHLGRGQGLAKTARDIITGITGVELREMENADQCCGFGGIMRITHPGVSNSIADRKAENITATRASAVVTGCPSCVMQLRDGLRRAGSDVNVLHTVQLIEEALLNSKCGVRNAE